MKISVVGAGPGGLYFSMLVKRALPDARVTVYEQNPRNATFGFGVALHGASWEFMRAESVECLNDIVAESAVFFGQHVVHKGERVFFSDTQPNAGIERLTLLKILQKHAEKVGVEIRHQQPLSNIDALADQDLIVGADGVNSIVRRSMDQAFGTTQRVLTARMAWYGLDKPIAPAQLVFKKTEFGYFWFVVYPHSKQHSTFVAECDDKAYQASGLAQMTPEQQVAFTERIFAEELDGARILYNNSVWRALPVIRVKEWSVGNRVLLGDALHSPHPSIGSGTRLSMGDAAALAESIAAHPDDVGAALRAYRIKREPSKMKLVEPMERSLEWYEHIADRLDDLSPVAVTFDWLGRTGRMGLDRLRDVAPDFFEKYGHLAPKAYLAQGSAAGAGAAA